MSKKDYIAIAACLKSVIQRDLFAPITIQLLADQLCRVLLADNPAFDACVFLTACGFPPARKTKGKK